MPTRPTSCGALISEFDSTRDGRIFENESMVDEHTRESLVDLTERSITGADFVNALDAIIAARGAPR